MEEWHSGVLALSRIHISNIFRALKKKLSGCLQYCLNNHNSTCLCLTSKFSWKSNSFVFLISKNNCKVVSVEMLCNDKHDSFK